MSSLSETNIHPRDERIRFVEDSHTYYIDGSKEGYISCTTLIHKLFEEFNADIVIKKMRSSRNWPKSKYNGMSDQEIKDGWEENRNTAASNGTMMHENIENYYNGDTHETSSREFKMFSNYVDDHPGLSPFRTEWVIFDSESKVCGSVDMIYKSQSGKYIMADWKRSKEIKKENMYQRGKDSNVSHLDDCNFVHYSLQLGIYKYILQKNYGIEIEDMFIVVLHPNQAVYLKIYTKNVDIEVGRIMSKRMNPCVNIDNSKNSKNVVSMFKMESLKF